ncbi:MAG: hypothetical protein R2730_09015 [Chitinophagales bacterium]
MKTLAPIILFVYNRPWHTEQTLLALSKNKLAKESTLYIYADGAQENTKEVDIQKIEKVRALIKSKQWCKEVNIVERTKNWGLAENIVDGVTKLVKEYGKIIVLEDDIVTSNNFLKYMNDALLHFKGTKQVMNIGGFWPETNPINSDFFLIQYVNPWGWATWSDRWALFNKDSSYLINEIKSKNQIKKFNVDGTSDYAQFLIKNCEGEKKTWATNWYATVFTNNGLSLYPSKSMVRNIGFDGSGEHYTKVKKNEEDIFYVHQLSHNTEPDFTKIQPIKEKKQARKQLKQLFKYGKNSTLLYRIKSDLYLLKGQILSSKTKE